MSCFEAAETICFDSGPLDKNKGNLEEEQFGSLNGGNKTRVLCRSAARTLKGNLGAVGSKTLAAQFAVGTNGSGALLAHKDGARAQSKLLCPLNF